MSDNVQLYLQILNIILSFLSPFIFASAYLIRKISKSQCFRTTIEFNRSDSLNEESPKNFN